MAGGPLVRQGENCLAKERQTKTQTTQEWDSHRPSYFCQFPLNSSQWRLGVLGCGQVSCRHGSLPDVHHCRYWLLFMLTYHLRPTDPLRRRRTGVQKEWRRSQAFLSPLADVQLLLLHRKCFPSFLQERRNILAYFKVSAKENNI